MDSNSDLEIISAEPEMVNRRLMVNRPDVVEELEEVLNRPGALANARTPQFAIDSEKAIHRLMLLLKLKGFTNHEIAEHCGYTDAWVSQITRQPWFQERLAELLEQAEEDVYEGLLKIEGRASLVTLVELRDHAKSEQVRATCAINILDRLKGKPVQRSESVVAVTHMNQKLNDIDKELAAVEVEEKRLLSLGTSNGEQTRSTVDQVTEGDDLPLPRVQLDR